MHVKLFKATVKCVVCCVMIKKNQAGNSESRDVVNGPSMGDHSIVEERSQGWVWVGLRVGGVGSRVMRGFSAVSQDAYARRGSLGQQ